MISLVLQITLGLILAVTESLTVYMVGRAILGFVCVSVVFSGFVLYSLPETTFMHMTREARLSWIYPNTGWPKQTKLTTKNKQNELLRRGG
ncbi:uncharacterized protein LOC128998437 isoform X2 [Macrosteles quadrilineatus]|uniref:uncharacterized protein LOC128998437 isoform X2 n=1 Tax=Macrosteles quadrilineatus TaxID=74068 RepID=UPI0023E2689D|nr:uncharacterized protein LOC128998437 isoform X2 [Macrosteles quadrilineatus]XP_054280538.1 uncharacterized protein LOC128998437 isoform X2 [Macrosteles quadrilineatus]